MREIEFRGMATIDEEEMSEWLIQHSGKWVHGTPIEDYIVSGIVEANDEYIAIEQPVRVDPDTISQYTGLKDKNGKKIFEGDICWYERGKSYGEVFFEEGRFLWENEAMYGDLWEIHDILEVIGNKWENPELLEEVE